QTENELWVEYYADYLHVCPLRELCKRLETHMTRGLTYDEARIKLERNGQNILPITVLHTPFMLRMAQYSINVFGIVVFLSALTCFFIFFNDNAGKSYDGLSYLIVGVILITIFLVSGFAMMRLKNDKEPLINAFDDMMPMYCTVVRESEKVVILSRNVVVGDIVPISYGQRLPADIRFFHSYGLELNKVALVGFTDPVPVLPLPGDGLEESYESQRLSG
ncbi:hypothetical protein KR018_004752, partial [Drosophila ironensis]